MIITILILLSCNKIVFPMAITYDDPFGFQTRTNMDIDYTIPWYAEMFLNVLKKVESDPRHFADPVTGLQVSDDP